MPQFIGQVINFVKLFDLELIRDARRETCILDNLVRFNERRSSNSSCKNVLDFYDILEFCSKKKL